MKVKALFAGGSASAVGIELDASPEPKVFLLGQPKVLLSAERGVSTAYLYLRRRGLVHGPYTGFCELVADAGRAAGLLGESAGLAFALAALARGESRGAA